MNPEELRMTLRRHGGDQGPSLGERLIEAARRVKFASPLHKQRLKGRFPLKLLATPEDPLPGDPATGERLKGGRLYHAGYGQGFADARFDTPDASQAWRDWANGWGWLRDLAAVGDPARDGKRTQALAGRWLEQFPTWHRDAWRPDVTGRRLLMWAMYAPWVFNNEHIHRSAVLNGIARWARHLDRAVTDMPVSWARFEAAAGLYAAGLLLPGGEQRLAEADRLIDDTLRLMMHADGSAVSRCPLELARVGDLLLVLAACHAARGLPVSGTVASRLVLLRVALGGMLMGDGVPSPWHGGAPTRAQLSRLGVVPAGEPCTESGFQRLDGGTTRVMVDAAPPPPARVSDHGHASTLAITVSDGTDLLLVNCGGGMDLVFPAELRTGLRSTAAHCTLVVDDTNSTRLQDDSARHAVGVEAVEIIRRRTDEGQYLDLRHDGYARRFGLVHGRRLFLAADGNELRGEDALTPAGRPLRARTHKVVVRFHLGPEAKVALTEDGLGALILLPGAGWLFRATFKTGQGMLTIEPSLWVAPSGEPRPTQQLTLSTDASNARETAFGWSFRRQQR